LMRACTIHDSFCVHSMAPRTAANEIGISNEPIETYDVADEKAAIKQADAALQFLRAEAGDAADVDQKALLRKIDWMVMPLMFGAYLSQFFDKSLLNYAAVMGMSSHKARSCNLILEQASARTLA
jgi:hypothetical protein